jgi:hypothetical protein
MIYLTLDTCVWLAFLKTDYLNNDNPFDEIYFYIENKHIIHILPENILAEWNRNKTKEYNKVVLHYGTPHLSDH